MWNDFIFRLRSIVNRSAAERELDSEVRYHIDRQIAIYIEAGVPAAEAERRAVSDFGGVASIKEDTRQAWGIALLDTIFRDFRYAVRVLAGSPAFTLVAVVSLALGIGANTAIFTLLDALRLRALPVKSPEQLAFVHVADMDGARGSRERPDSVTYPIWEQIRQHQEAFSGIFAWSESSLNLAPEGEVRMENALWVSGEFFPVLGIRPVAGRLFEPSDDQRGCGAPGAVVSYSFWKNELGGESSAIGRRLTLNSLPVQVIGVTPPDFFGLDVGRSFAVALPLCSEPQIRGFNALDAGTIWWLTIMGRVKPGWTMERASAQVRAMSTGIFEASLPANYPRVSVNNYLGMQLIAEPAKSGISGLRSDYRDPLNILLAIAGFVLLIACVNLANLILARASVRGREIAVRLALGASRNRLLTQLMIENLLIAITGAGFGLLLAGVLSRVLVTRLSTDKSIYLDLHADWPVLLFTSALAILTCLLFGLAPALRASRRDTSLVLVQSGRGTAGSKERFAMRRMLAATQVALSLVLLVGSLMFTGSLRRLLRVDLGFQSRNVVVADFGFARATPLKTPVIEYQRNLIQRIAAIPGVDAVADSNIIPLSGRSTSNAIWPDGAAQAGAIDALRSRISPGYFRTLGIHFVAGRDFDTGDTSQSQNVAIVSREFARRVMNTPAPIGRRFRMEATPSTPETVYEIVDVADNTKYGSLREDLQPILYLPLAQDPAPHPAGDQLMIRSTLAPAALIPVIRKAIAAFDPGARFDFGEMQELIDASVLRERLMATLSTGFGLLAGVLAAIGIYGVIAYSVSRRTNEIGIRMALGATVGQMQRMVLGESVRVVAVGVFVGTALSLWVVRFARSLLYGIEAGNVAAFIWGAAILASVALLAAWVPARRAARLDPTSCLRAE